MSKPERFYYESKVADKLELSRDDVRFLREDALKKEKGDWCQPGRDVLLSEAGLRIILDIVGYTAPIENFSDCLTTEKTEPVELTVIRLYPNRRLLQASNDELGEVTVRVSDNSNFRPTMTLKAIPPAPGKAAVYQLAGRCPRYPGRM